MLTIVETLTFSGLWPDYWSEEELGEFCFWLAVRPDAGDVIQGSGGCHKVRWSREGKGKSRVRVIYYNRLTNGEIWLLTMYAKSQTIHLLCRPQVPLVTMAEPSRFAESFSPAALLAWLAARQRPYSALPSSAGSRQAINRSPMSLSADTYRRSLLHSVASQESGAAPI